MTTEHNYVLTGVGGQGILLAATTLGRAATDAGHDVRVGEMHGMSQRGGSVLAHVRYGPTVYGPMVPKGKADAIVALEPMEALRYTPYLRDDGMILSSTERDPPFSVTTGEAAYPDEAVLATELRNRGELIRIDASEMAREAGNPRTGNIVLLGALSVVVDLDIDTETVRAAIDKSVPPDTTEANRRAFDLGRTIPTESIPGQ